MLEIKPNCECCDKDLPADSKEAYICSYECTFCKDCLDNKLFNVCPNCGGGLNARPIRPKTPRRKGVSLGHHAASTKRVNTGFTESEIKQFCESIKDIKPCER